MRVRLPWGRHAGSECADQDGQLGHIDVVGGLQIVGVLTKIEPTGVALDLSVDQFSSRGARYVRHTPARAVESPFAGARACRLSSRALAVPYWRVNRRISL